MLFLESLSNNNQKVLLCVEARPIEAVCETYRASPIGRESSADSTNIMPRILTNFNKFEAAALILVSWLMFLMSWDLVCQSISL